MCIRDRGKTVPATFLASARQGIFFIPIVLILSSALGVFGIQIAQSVSDVITLACAIPIQLVIMKNMKNSDSNTKKEDA